VAPQRRRPAPSIGSGPLRVRPRC